MRATGAVVCVTIFLAAATSAFVLESTAATPKVKLDLYYETKCPFCKIFILNQLVPNFKKFEKYMEIGLNPFGNAHDAGPDPGLWDNGQRFTCQHGKNECFNGKVHSCIINKLGDKSFPVIACLESREEIIDIGKCLSKNGIVNYSNDQVMKCAKGQEGTDLFAKFGEKTSKIFAGVKEQFVPWIQFNGDYNKTLEVGAITNLKATLCKYLLKDVPECQ